MQTLRGNHEDSCLIDIQLEKRGWKSVGEESFMDSFGVQKLSEIPKEYFDWMQALPLWLETDNHILVHAGLNFRENDPLQDHADMMWIRDWYPQMDMEWMKDLFIIHGHTPQTIEEIKMATQRMDCSRVLGIDNGCFILNEHRVFGHLCVFEMNNRTLHFEPNRETNRRPIW